MKMLKIKEDTHHELTIIIGILTARNGKIGTYDDAVKELLSTYKRRSK